MIKKYIKKPIPIEAIQWTGKNLNEIKKFTNQDVCIKNGHLILNTLEGTFVSKNKTGDWIIKGIKGEFYICEKTIFEESYIEYNDERSYICTQMMY